MFRKGFTTPQPLQGRIRKMAKQEVSKNGSVSLVSSFDQMTRNCAVLQEGAEDTFLKFVIGQAKCRERWQLVETQIERVIKQLEDCQAEVNKLEIKLGQARDLLSVETTARKKAEQERDQLYRQLDSVKEVLRLVCRESCSSSCSIIYKEFGAPHAPPSSCRGLGGPSGSVQLPLL